MGRSNGYRRRWTINHVLHARAEAMVVRMVGSWASIIAFASVKDAKKKKRVKAKRKRKSNGWWKGLQLWGGERIQLQAGRLGGNGVANTWANTWAWLKLVDVGSDF